MRPNYITDTKIEVPHEYSIINYQTVRTPFCSSYKTIDLSNESISGSGVFWVTLLYRRRNRGGATMRAEVRISIRLSLSPQQQHFLQDPRGRGNNLAPMPLTSQRSWFEPHDGVKRLSVACR